ncbi:Ig-like domain-containing protein [Bacteroidota bacterium]
MYLRFFCHFLAIAFLVFIMGSCEKEPENKPPEVKIITPSDNAEFEKKSVISIRITSEDPEGTPVDISLYIDGIMVDETSEKSLDYEWDTEDVTLGEHIIKASATDAAELEGSATITVTIGAIKLAKPGGLSLIEESGQLNIGWNSVDKAQGYVLYWTDDGSDPGIGSDSITGISSSGYLHKDLDYKLTYKYKVCAVHDEFRSPLSNVISGSPEIGPLDPPTGLVVTKVGSALNASWDPVTGEGITYTLKRKESSGWSKTTVASNITETSYLDNSIEAGYGYYYEVIAEDPANSRVSEASDRAYGVTSKTINESEINNQNITNTLSYSTHYWEAEKVTFGLDKFKIKGGYSGSYAIYSSGYYKSYEADCFRLDIEKGDVIEFRLISGKISGLWDMKVGINNYYKYTSGNTGDGEEYKFTSSTDSYTYRGPSIGELQGTYLNITMWEDLVNYGPYNYEIEITITRH